MVLPYQGTAGYLLLESLSETGPASTELVFGLRLCGRRKHTSVSLQDASLKFLQGFWLELVEFPVRDSGQPAASKREIHRGSQGGL